MAFATIVSLLADFVAHRNSAQAANLDEFQSWLAERHHHDVLALLQTTAGAAVSTKALLAETREVLMARLAALERALVQYAGNVAGFEPLARAVAPNSLLSDQATSILRQIDLSGASKVLELHHGTDGGTSLLYMDGGTQGAVQLSDQRFLQDDLRTLVELNLLRPDRNSSGGRLFHFTRAAAALLRIS
jgi:hypothetical protein